MKITIEESKRNLNHAIKWKDRPTDESMALAIETMHKYQKIEQILHNGFGKGVYAVFDEIIEVVQDGIPAGSTAKIDVPDNKVGDIDCISRKAVQTRLKEIINEMETIFADIREREVNDSVCGLCEYDCDHGLDGFANECPGFEKDDCFKLNEKYRAEWLDISNLPSVTPQESILDRARAEIQDIAFDWQEIDGEHESFMVVDLNDALNIIDKYKAESEPQESEG